VLELPFSKLKAPVTLSVSNARLCHVLLELIFSKLKAPVTLSVSNARLLLAEVQTLSAELSVFNASLTLIDLAH
jgi:hypothetical protein